MNFSKFTIVSLLLALALSACAGDQANPGEVEPTPASATATPTTLETPAATPTQSLPSPTPDELWIHLAPDTGEAGTEVQVSGYLPGGPTAGEAAEDPSLSSATLCWGGCLEGLTFVDRPVSWSESEPGHFAASFSVPMIPWLSADGPAPLTPGDYLVGIQCLGIVEGCALEEAQAGAIFELSGAAHARCYEGAPCAELAFTPAHAAPGDPVQVDGWAPLVEVLGDRPFGYSLVLIPEDSALQPLDLGQLEQTLDGDLSGTFQVPQQLPGLGLLTPGTYTLALQAYRPQTNQALTLAPTTFEIATGLVWSDLEIGSPVRIEPSASLVEPFTLAVDPGNPQRLAYCAPGEIRVTADGSASWASIPTGPVAELAAGTTYPLFTGGDPAEAACASVTLDSGHPDSFYAVFETQNANFGAPPVFFQAYTTADRGATWRAVPAPSAELIEGFGGFWSDPDVGVEALFSPTGFDPAQADQVTVLQTTDGGRTWIPDVGLSCPSDGACLRWGPASGSIPGMGSPLPQPVLYSADGGGSWGFTGLTAELRLPGSELAAFTDQRALLLATGADYPVRLTRDGGETWQVVNLPVPEGYEGDFPFFQGLKILPDGSLLAPAPDGDSWLLLSPEGDSWCPVASSELPPPPVQPRLAGEQLWWLDPASGGPRQISLAQVVCARP